MMRFALHTVPWLAVLTVAVSGCSSSSGPEDVAHDPQTVEIHLQYGFLNELNTFEGTLTKDLAMDGSVSVEFWMPAADQDSILEKAEQLSFFDLPDTIPCLTGVAIDPDPSPDWLRIRSRGKDQTVVWTYPLDAHNVQAAAVRELADYIFSLVRRNPVYILLPPARGARL
jgi:hypothetical protein